MKRSSIIVVILLLLLMAISIWLVLQYPDWYIVIDIFLMLALVIIYLIFSSINRCPNCGHRPRYLFQKHCTYCGEKFDKNFSDYE